MSSSPKKYSLPNFQFSPMKLDSPSPLKRKQHRSPSSSKSRSGSLNRSPMKTSFDFGTNEQYSYAQVRSPVRPLFEILEDIKQKSPENYSKMMKSIEDDYKKSMAAKRKKTTRTIFVPKKLFVPSPPKKSMGRSSVVLPSSESQEATQVIKSKSKSPRRKRSPTKSSPIKKLAIPKGSESEIEATQQI